MNIIIVGAGEVGKHLAQSLSTQLHNITLIDHSEEVTAALHEKLDASVVIGNGTSATVLAENNVADCELFLAITSHDNTNLAVQTLPSPSFDMKFQFNRNWRANPNSQIHRQISSSMYIT